MIELTPRQEMVKQAMREFKSEHGYMPSVRQLCAATGIGCTNGVVCHLKALEAKGHLKRVKGGARAMVLTEDLPESARPKRGQLRAILTDCRRRVQVELPDHPLTPAEARLLAVALSAQADRIEGKL